LCVCVCVYVCVCVCVAFNDAKDTLKIMYEKQSNCLWLKKKDGGKTFHLQAAFI